MSTKLETMPFLSDDEVLDYQTQIEEAKEQKRVTDYAHTKVLRDTKEEVQKYKIASILLGILALIGIAGTVYFLFFNQDLNRVSKEKYSSDIKDYQTKVSELEETVRELSMAAELENNQEASKKPTLENELVYAVQIGAYRNEIMDLSMYSDKFVNFKEIKGEPFNKYAIGNFATLKEAQNFRKQVVRLGLKNAFIASYQNGERLRIEKPR